jgi:hypothetical protein
MRNRLFASFLLCTAVGQVSAQTARRTPIRGCGQIPVCSRRTLRKTTSDATSLSSSSPPAGIYWRFRNQLSN